MAEFHDKISYLLSVEYGDQNISIKVSSLNDWQPKQG